LAESLPEQRIAALEKTVEEEMDRAVEFARQSPEPDVAEFLREVEAGR
jgi:TPP-dependent pyruvate/acetoin dehydrogenase alpha subunit